MTPKEVFISRLFYCFYEKSEYVTEPKAAGKHNEKNSTNLNEDNPNDETNDKMKITPLASHRLLTIYIIKEKIPYKTYKIPTTRHCQLKSY